MVVGSKVLEKVGEVPPIEKNVVIANRALPHPLPRHFFSFDDFHA